MESHENVSESATMPLGARMLNVIAAPGELFTALTAAPRSLSNWLVPAIVVGLVGLIVTWIVFSQPAMTQEIRRLQDREFQKQVEKGKMTEAQADQAKQAMEGFGMVIAKVAGSVMAVFTGFLAPLWWGFLAWLAVRLVFRTPLPYWRAVEVAGLTSLIGALGMVVGLFLSMGLGRLFAGPHLGLFVSEFDMTNRAHLGLGAVNLFGLWQLAILALGVAKLVGRPFLPVGIVLMGVWVGYKAIAVALGLAQFAL